MSEKNAFRPEIQTPEGKWMVDTRKIDSNYYHQNQEAKGKINQETREGIDEMRKKEILSFADVQSVGDFARYIEKRWEQNLDEYEKLIWLDNTWKIVYMTYLWTWLELAKWFTQMLKTWEQTVDAVRTFGDLSTKDLEDLSRIFSALGWIWIDVLNVASIAPWIWALAKHTWLTLQRIWKLLEKIPKPTKFPKILWNEVGAVWSDISGLIKKEVLRSKNKNSFSMEKAELQRLKSGWESNYTSHSLPWETHMQRAERVRKQNIKDLEDKINWIQDPRIWKTFTISKNRTLWPTEDFSVENFENFSFQIKYIGDDWVQYTIPVVKSSWLWRGRPFLNPEVWEYIEIRDFIHLPNTTGIAIKSDWIGWIKILNWPKSIEIVQFEWVRNKWQSFLKQEASKIPVEQQVLSGIPRRNLNKLPYNEVKRSTDVVAIPDVHGDLRAFDKSLQNQWLIDETWKWIGWDTRVVQTWDIFDRWSEWMRILERINDLKKQWANIELLAGNHENMLFWAVFEWLESDVWRHWLGNWWVNEIRSTRLNNPGPFMGEIREHLGSTYKNIKLVEQIDDVLYLHAEPSLELAQAIEKYWIDWINKKYQEAIQVALKWDYSKLRNLSSPSWEFYNLNWSRWLSSGTISLNNQAYIWKVFKENWINQVIHWHTPPEGSIANPFRWNIVDWVPVINLDGGISKWVNGQGARIWWMKIGKDWSHRIDDSYGKKWSRISTSNHEDSVRTSSVNIERILNPKDKIASAQSLHELKEAIRWVWDIKGSTQIYTPEELTRLIDNVVNWDGKKYTLRQVTSTYGIRDKVQEIIAMKRMNETSFHQAYN